MLDAITGIIDTACKKSYSMNPYELMKEDEDDDSSNPASSRSSMSSLSSYVQEYPPASGENQNQEVKYQPANDGREQGM